MSWYKQDGKYWERVLLHIKYDTIIIVSVVAIYMLFWKIFFYDEQFIKAFFTSLVFGIWSSTLIKFYLKLPHFNIPYTYSKNKKNTIYIIDIIFASFGVYYYFFVFTWV